MENENKRIKKKGKDKRMAKVRKFTVNRHILKVVREAVDLKKDAKKFRFVKHEMRPPLTSTYIHFDSLRQVHNLRRSIQYDVVKSEKNDAERDKELEEVKTTCESYKKIMLNFTNFIDQNREKRERTVQQMDENIVIIKEASIEIRRLMKAAQDLLTVRDIMQKVIDENSPYVEFLNEVVSKSTRYKSIEMLVNRHEALINTRSRLIDHYLKLMTDIEMAKLESLKTSYSNVMSMVTALGKLQQVDYMLTVIQNEAKAASEIAEENNQEEGGVEKLDLAKTKRSNTATFLVSPVVTFIERLADKLITVGMVDKSLHQRPLPQQVEAIRSEYFRKLDIIRNYRENLEAKHRRKEKKALAEKKKEESKMSYDKRHNHLLERAKVLGLEQFQPRQKKSPTRRRGRRLTDTSDESRGEPEGKIDDKDPRFLLEEPSTMDDLPFDIASIMSVTMGSDDTDSISASVESIVSTATRH